jgi:hypothetical protein
MFWVDYKWSKRELDGKKWRWPTLEYYHGVRLEGLRRPTNIVANKVCSQFVYKPAPPEHQSSALSLCQPASYQGVYLTFICIIIFINFPPLIFYVN